MERKYYLHELSDKDKRRFYSQEIFEDYSRVKILLILIIFLIMTCDTLYSRVIRPLGEGKPMPSFFTLDILGLVLGIVIYSLSFSRPFQKKTPMIIRMRVLLNSLATCMVSFYVFYLQYDRLYIALVTNTRDDWIRAYITLSQAIYMLLGIILLTPVWYLKAMVAVSYYIGITGAFVRVGNSETLWMIIKCGMSITYSIALVALTANFRWRLFLKGLEADAWNQVYSEILNRNPSPIAVIQGNNKIIYSNSEFQKLVRDTPEEFFKRITNLKKRSHLLDPKNIGAYSNSILNLEESKDPLYNDIQSKSALNKNSAIYMSPTMNNLSELINQYLTLVDSRRLTNTDQAVFDGKLVDSFDKSVAFSYEIIIRPLVEYRKIIIILNNTTERDLLVALENNNEYKDQVLASVSHELRTPLNGSLGCLQAAINDSSVSKTVKEKFLLPALRSGKLLSHLINDILDYSQVKTNKIVPVYELRPLRETLERCCQLLEDAFCSKNLEFNLIIDGSLPSLFKTDHERLSQIVLNLLSNALKFTMQGGVTLEAWNVGGELEIRVKDTGVGIRKKDLTKLFDETPINNRKVRNKRSGKGIGLGLKISNTLVKLLSPSEKDIQVESVVGQGSTFIFTIENKICPLNFHKPSSLLERIPRSYRPKIESDIEKNSFSDVEIPFEYLSEEKATITKGSLSSYGREKCAWLKPKEATTSARFSMLSSITQDKKKCVLIVDDDRFNIIALEAMLNGFDVAIESANNGQEAVDKVMANPLCYQLIFMDCQMPVMNGYEASLILTNKMQKGELPSIPIIGCTAFTAKDKIEECFRCGMKEVINKPVLINKLKDILKEFLQLS